MRRYALWLVVLVVLVVGSQYVLFEDECDNFMGGRVIASGGTLYRDYWSHHMPLAYQMSAVFYALGARTYEQFRLAYALLVWLWGLALYRCLRSSLVTALWLLLALVAVPMESQMLMAESLIGYLALTAWLLMRANRPALIPAAVICLWLIPAAGLRQVYLAAALFILLCWQFRVYWRRILLTLCILTGLSAAYVLASGSVWQMVEQAYVFNQAYYLPYYGGQSGASLVDAVLGQPGNIFNALRHVSLYEAPVIMAWFPVLALLLYWLRRRRWLDVLLVVTLVVWSYPPGFAFYLRGHYFTTHLMLIVALAGFAVWLAAQSKIAPGRKLAAVTLLALVLAPAVRYNAVPLSDEDATVQRVGEMAGSAPVWMAPADFCNWLAVDNPNAAAPYYFVYPWLWDDPAIRGGILAALQEHPPVLVIYRAQQRIAAKAEWTMPHYAPELDTWIRGHYVEVEKDIWLRK